MNYLLISILLTGLFWAAAQPVPPFVPLGPGGGFVAAEPMMPGRMVRNSPYSAEAVTETVQALADGNRITRRSSAALYRDSEGRTRREQSMGIPGSAAGDGMTVLIQDPVARVHWVLDTRQKTARKMSLSGPQGPPGRGDVMIDRGRTFERPIGPPPLAPAEANIRSQSRNEPLGRQTIEGVAADGMRTVVTIAAGQIGNERPIETVFERWFSPELQTVVLSKHSDPRYGETTYRLTNIRHTEPDRALFEPPADYKVEEPQRMVRPLRQPSPDGGAKR